MQGARILRNEAYLSYVGMTKDEAQRRRWTFYKAVNFCLGYACCSSGLSLWTKKDRALLAGPVNLAIRRYMLRKKYKDVRTPVQWPRLEAIASPRGWHSPHVGPASWPNHAASTSLGLRWSGRSHICGMIVLKCTTFTPRLYSLSRSFS